MEGGDEADDEDDEEDDEEDEEDDEEDDDDAVDSPAISLKKLASREDVQEPRETERLCGERKKGGEVYKLDSGSKSEVEDDLDCAEG